MKLLHNVMIKTHHVCLLALIAPCFVPSRNLNGTQIIRGRLDRDHITQPVIQGSQAK